jgi:predicted AAA+ superfamily ATPase
MEETVLRMNQSFPVILITGPRQAGKTTMLRELAIKEDKERGYVSLDDLNERKMAKTDPALFLQIHQAPLIIDEVQYAPELFTYIKIHVDKHRRAGDFWLTGSQIFRMMRGVQESLAGRVGLLRLSPLSQREIGKASCFSFTTDFKNLLKESKKIQPVSVREIYERIWKGSMPGIIHDVHADRGNYYSSYISTYLERDVRDLSGEIDTLKFVNFITAVSARIGQTVNFNSLAVDADINLATAKDWLNILETLGIVFFLRPYSNNVLKRTIKTPKLYFYDTGLVCYLTKWSSSEVAMNGAMNGALLENYAISEIVKGYQNASKEPYLHYYRDRDGKEIDLLIEGDGKLCPVEIKKTATPEKRLTRVFKVIDKSPLLLGTSAILCMTETLVAFDKDNLIVPIGML